MNIHIYFMQGRAPLPQKMVFEKQIYTRIRRRGKRKKGGWKTGAFFSKTKQTGKISGK